MTFTHLTPYRTANGDVITAKALVTVHGTQHLECYENSDKHNPETITPITPEEYQVYMENDLE